MIKFFLFYRERQLLFFIAFSRSCNEVVHDFSLESIYFATFKFASSKRLSHSFARFNAHAKNLFILSSFVMLLCDWIKKKLKIMYSKHYSLSLLKIKLSYNRQFLRTFRKLLISILLQVSLKWMCTSPLEPSLKIKLTPYNGHFPPIFNKFLTPS